MPKAPVLSQHALLEKLLTFLAQSGPAKAADRPAALKISQPTFSRLIKQAPNSILRIGRGRQTRYAAVKLGPWGKSEVPVFFNDEKGALHQIAKLFPLSPKGFYLESHVGTLSTRTYESLPYFFEDLRPSGFLGRLVPRLYPNLGFPADINVWSDDDSLLYFARCGWDLVGNFMIGEESCEHYVENMAKGLDVIAENDRKKAYPKNADLVLSTGIPGSSAAGEQPKFLSIRGAKKGLLPVIVKFSPPISDAISRRIADLLICEHIAHEVLRGHGKASPKSCLVEGGGRLFLEVERFDRNIDGGRRGVISLRALDLEFVGQLRSWADTAASLLRNEMIDEVAYKDIVWLEAFGRLIGNTDRHHGNVSFFCDGETIFGLAPAYDMLPMMYAPQQNQLVERRFDPEPPKFFELPVWNDALTAARDFWSRVQRHARISGEFKAVIAENESKLSSFSTTTTALPVR